MPWDHNLKSSSGCRMVLKAILKSRDTASHGDLESTELKMRE